jgi:hypothetical protein
VPVFKGVSNIVYWQDKHFDGTGFPYEATSGDDIAKGAQILHLLRDILSLEAKGLRRSAALTACEERAGRYDPALLAKAKELFSTAEEEHLVTFAQLEPGMVLRSSIKDERGRLLLGPGVQMTEAMMKRLTYIHETRGLQGPFEVSLVEE